MELTDRELEDRKKNIKYIEELLHKLIIVSKDETDKFDEQKIKKIRPNLRKWFDWLTNKNVMRKKPKIIRDKLKDKTIRDSRLSETKNEDRKKKKHNGRINKDRTIRYIRTLFVTKKEEGERNKKKEHNERLIKDGILRDIRILLEQDENDKYYYKSKRVNNFWNNNYIQYDSNGVKNKNLSLEEYLNKIET